MVQEVAPWVVEVEVVAKEVAPEVEGRAGVEVVEVRSVER